MSTRSHILVVAHQAGVAEQLTSWLDYAGYGVSRANTFAAGKARLAAGTSETQGSVHTREPEIDLVIAEVKLGDYNGLHLALRARAAGIPAIVIGEPDLALEREAENLGAAYLPEMPSRTRLLEAIRQQLPAQEPAGVPAQRSVASDSNGDGGGRHHAARLR